MEINAAQFGLRSGDHDSSGPLRAMAEHARTQPGTTLRIPPGRYVLRDPEAVALMNRVLAGEWGVNPEKAMFRPYFPYVRGLDFRGARDLTILADGVELICDGWMEPVSLEGCRNVRLAGLTIDHRRKPFSLGRIVGVGEGCFDVEFGAEYPVVANTAMTRVGFWDFKARRMCRHFIEGGTASELIAPQILRIRAALPEVDRDCEVMVSHTYHFRPALLIFDCENVRIERVTIHSQPGMGVVAHRSKDMGFYGLRVVPRPGFHISTNTDATHMTSCNGFIHLEGCQFQGAGDDSTNIHSYYYTIADTDEPGVYDLSVQAPTFTHAQVLDYPDPGDTLELVERDSLRPLAEYRVLTAANDVPGWRTRVRLDRPLPADHGHLFLADVTRQPEVRIINCTLRQHRGRGVLLKTRRAHVEGCTFEGLTGTPVFVGAEGGWHEGVTSHDIVIRHNWMIDCNNGDRWAHGTCGVMVGIGADKLDVPGLYRRIVIEDNIITGEGVAHAIYINAGDQVVIRDNQLAGCREPIALTHCTATQIENNRIS